MPHLASNGGAGARGRRPAEGRDEAALFHLLNLARERGAPSCSPPRRPVEACGLATPDLLSRLRLAPSVATRPPDDALLTAVLVKLFVDRQLVVDLSVVESLALRIDRSLARAREVVAELDREALEPRPAHHPALALAVLERRERRRRAEDDRRASRRMSGRNRQAPSASARRSRRA